MSSRPTRPDTPHGPSEIDREPGASAAPNRPPAPSAGEPVSARKILAAWVFVVAVVVIVVVIVA